MAALDELRQSLKAAQAALRDANMTYDQAEREHQAARTKVQQAWDARAEAARNVDRHYRAIDAINSLTTLPLGEHTAPPAPQPVPTRPDVDDATDVADDGPQPDPSINHGTEYAYRNKHCRCDICKDGKRQRNAEYKARSRGKVRAPRITVKPRPSSIPASTPETPIVELDASISCAKPEPPQVKRGENIPGKIPATPGVTARCQDCTRTFTLTGRLLDQAIALHELKHAHIVNVLGGEQ